MSRSRGARGPEQPELHPEWSSHVFDLACGPVRSFLISSALFWLEKYHVDGLRVDGVASLLFLDQQLKEENPAGANFLRLFTSAIRDGFPDALTVAEDSSAWPGVSRPAEEGGLGFSLKWDLGWMHDTLEYFAQDPIRRKHHHSRLTFRNVYAFKENFLLPLSHDEVKPGYGSLLAKMPGDEWQKFANLRLLLAYMYAQPGKKLLFMGGEFGQRREWNHHQSLDWHLLDLPPHAGLRSLAGTLNWLYKSEPALHELDCDPAGFEWIDGTDAERSILCFLRKGRSPEPLLVVCNFTPVPRYNYRVGVPHGGWWREIFNSDTTHYGGAGYGNLGGVEATPIGSHGRRYSVNLTLPPLSALYFR
jgi:1,4-alpha-glucan branching enzyme